MKNTILSGTIVVLIAIGAAGWIMYLHTSNQLSTLKAETEKKEEKISKTKKKLENLQEITLALDTFHDSVDRKWTNEELSEKSKSALKSTFNELNREAKSQKMQEMEVYKELNLGD